MLRTSVLRSKRLNVSLACLISIALVGCSSDDNSSSNTDGKPTETTVPAPTGTPILVGGISGQNVGSAGAQTEAGGKAAAAAINKAGGVNGHPIEVKICGDDGDANVAGKCARDQADNPDFVALVGTNSNYQDVIDPVIEAAKLPSVGQSLLGLPDFGSPMVFPIAGGPLVGIAAGAPICINDLGKQTVAMAYLEQAVGAQAVGLIDGFALKPFGKKLVKAVPVPLTATDVTAQAAEIVGSNADCTVILAGAESAAQVIVALKQQGYKGQIMTSGAVFSLESLLEAIGKEDAEGVILTQIFDYASPLADQFIADMKAVDETAMISDLALQTWLSVHIVADTAKGLTTIDRASMLAALQQLKNYDTQGLTKIPLDFTSRVANPAVLGGIAPNLILPFALGMVVKDGKLAPITGNWQNAFTGPNQS